LAEIDPKGERKALFDYRRNPRSIKPGDIVRVTFKNGDPFNGVVLSIKMRGIDSSFLLRNELTRVAVEMSVKVFNPNVSSVEIVQRAERQARRARLYYMRFVNPLRFTDLLPLLIRSLSIDPANTTAAVSRTSWPPTSARRGRSWVVVVVVPDGVKARVRCRFAYSRMYYSLSIFKLTFIALST
jgi:ribosomal protein L19